MEYEYVKNADGKIVDIKVNGKAVKPMYMRGFKKAQDTPYFRMVKQDSLARNLVTGITKVLNPLEATIYNFCMEWYRRYAGSNNTFSPVQTFDDMKYFLMELNPDAYYDLLD